MVNDENFINVGTYKLKKAGQRSYVDIDLTEEMWGKIKKMRIIREPMSNNTINILVQYK